MCSLCLCTAKRFLAEQRIRETKAKMQSACGTIPCSVQEENCSWLNKPAQARNGSRTQPARYDRSGIQRGKRLCGVPRHRFRKTQVASKALRLCLAEVNRQFAPLETGLGTRRKPLCANKDRLPARISCYILQVVATISAVSAVKIEGDTQ